MRSVTDDQILDAAYDQLLAFGLRKVSVEDVAKKVGIARITIYRRFAHKDDLLVAVAVREGQRLVDEVERAIDASASPEEQLVDGFAALFHAVRAHPLIQRTLASEPEIAASFLASRAGPIIAFARDIAATRLGVPAPVAEVMVRLSASFVLSPDSCIALDDLEDARDFARTYLVPMVPAEQEVHA